MILKGNSRAHGRELALHLLNSEDNEHVRIHELRGFLADDLQGAFKETEAIALGTKCQQYLFSLSLSPPQSANVSVEEFERNIFVIEKRLGLSDQPRAIVFHEKEGRRHAHCVWSRIDVSKMRAINLPHFKRRLMDISREIYLEQSWDMPTGLRNPDDRDPLNYSHAEAGQAKRTDRDPAKLKKAFKACWESSDSQSAFTAALLEKGFCLAQGDRRGFVAVDVDGEIYSLSRWCGVKTKELRARLSNRADLPDVEQATALLAKIQNSVDQDQQYDRIQKEHQDKVANVVARQRAERLDLSKAHEAHRIKALKEGQAGLPVGLKAAWGRLTGSYKEHVEKLVREAEQRNAQEITELQSLVEKHLAERQKLDREWEFVRAHHSFKAEFLQSISTSSNPRYAPDPRQPLVLPREQLPFTASQLKLNPALILNHISDKKASFSRNDIMRGLADFLDDPIELRTAADRALASPELVALPVADPTEFTTQAFQVVEKALSSCASELARSGGFGVNTNHINHAIKNENARLQRNVGARLSDEQINAINHILDPNQLSAIVGLAGTGKSTLLSVAKEAWARQGYRVHGAALAGKAADSLETSSGIASRTLASLEASWKSGYEPIGTGDIVVIDEAGMVGTRQLSRVTEHLRQLGCKLVLVGDPDQLQPIQAGTPFRDICDQSAAARLTEIRRQNTDWQRHASRDLAAGQIASAMQTYSGHGHVHEKLNRDDAIAALVDDFVSDWKTNGENTTRLALAHRRKDVHAINQAIRKAKQSATGAGTEVLFHTDHGPRAFAAGDRILFTRNDRDLGVRNGMLGTVEALADEQLTVRLDSEATHRKSTLAFSPREFPAIDHGYAVTIHRAQGCTVDRSFVLSSHSLDKNLTYVALTRHKQETGFYTARDIRMKQGHIEGRRPSHNQSEKKWRPSLRRR